MEILAIIGLLVVIFIAYRFFQQQSTSSGDNPSSTAQRPGSNELRIENVREGGMISVRNLGPDMEDLDLKVTARHLYNEEGYEWVELECDAGNRTIWLDVEDDDGIWVSATLSKLKLRDVGLSKNQLTRFDDDEEGSFTYQGTTYHYDDSNEATYYQRGDLSNPQKFYYWDFESDDEEHFIGVERWGSDYEAFYGVPVKQSQITVYSTSETA